MERAAELANAIKTFLRRETASPASAMEVSAMVAACFAMDHAHGNVTLAAQYVEQMAARAAHDLRNGLLRVTPEKEPTFQ